MDEVGRDASTEVGPRYSGIGPMIFLNVSCLYLETLLGKKVFKPLLNRSGLNCRIVIGGIIRNHERIEWCDPASLDISVHLVNEATPLENPTILNER
jgi:hypothetical protein